MFCQARWPLKAFMLSLVGVYFFTPCGCEGRSFGRFDGYQKERLPDEFSVLKREPWATQQINADHIKHQLKTRVLRDPNVQTHDTAWKYGGAGRPVAAKMLRAQGGFEAAGIRRPDLLRISGQIHAQGSGGQRKGGEETRPPMSGLSYNGYLRHLDGNKFDVLTLAIKRYFNPARHPLNVGARQKAASRALNLYSRLQHLEKQRDQTDVREPKGNPIRFIGRHL